ncbi:MAG: hypothetical protein ACRENL_11105 [Candidatus Dormibacteria bacterium]
MAFVAAPILALSPVRDAAAATSCNTGAGYYTPVQTYYSGGVDGSSAVVNIGNDGHPFLCNANTDHTLETVALVLPHTDGYGHMDTIENGAYEGIVCWITGTNCQIRSGSVYFYQEANIFSQGRSVLNVEGNNGGGNNAHNYSNQELVIGGRLYDQPVTDATGWATIYLPAGDNPGYFAIYQGEVYNASSDQMGQAVVTSPAVHAGTWQGWNTLSTLRTDATYPYCNIPNPPGGSYSYENYGPAPRGSGGCNG